MKLINLTAYPILMFRTALTDDKFAASVCARVTYNILSNKAIISSNQEWGLHKEPWNSEFGPMDSDNIYKRGGVDIFLFGNAKSPGLKPVRKMDVTVTIDKKLDNRITIFGNRIWQKSFAGINMSHPEFFTEMPLTLNNAYGGNAEWDSLKIPHGNNPLGKGYYWKKEDAINNPLPNIEDPKNYIKQWNDQPDPVGTSCCPACELRIRGNVSYTKEGQITEIRPRFFNSAFANMIANDILPGEKIIIKGMTPHEPFIFEVPKHTLKTKVSLGSRVREWELYIEQIGIIPDKMQTFITYRFPFNYSFRPHEIRTCEIFEN